MSVRTTPLDLALFEGIPDSKMGEFAPALLAECRRQQVEIVWLREALGWITEGRGPFSRDPYEHACNVIEAMKKAARDALAGVAEEGETLERAYEAARAALQQTGEGA